MTSSAPGGRTGNLLQAARLEPGERMIFSKPEVEVDGRRLALP